MDRNSYAIAICYITNKTHVRVYATCTPTLMALMCNYFSELNFESHIGQCSAHGASVFNRTWKTGYQTHQICLLFSLLSLEKPRHVRHTHSPDPGGAVGAGGLWPPRQRASRPAGAGGASSTFIIMQAAYCCLVLAFGDIFEEPAECTPSKQAQAHRGKNHIPARPPALAGMQLQGGPALGEVI